MPPPPTASVLGQLPDPEAIRDRLRCLLAEVRLLRRILPLAEAAAQHQPRPADQREAVHDSR